MPANIDVAREQLVRLSTRYGFPDREEELDALAQLLATLSRDDDRCRGIGDWLWRNCKFFPLPTDIDAAADELGGLERQPATWTGSLMKCRTCGDTGWISTPHGAERCDHHAAPAPEPQAVLPNTTDPEELRRLGLCDLCFGVGTRPEAVNVVPRGGESYVTHDESAICPACRGDGKFISPEEFRRRGVCEICRGSRVTSKGGKCFGCKGTGSSRPPAAEPQQRPVPPSWTNAQREFAQSVSERLARGPDADPPVIH